MTEYYICYMTIYTDFLWNLLLLLAAFQNLLIFFLVLKEIAQGLLNTKALRLLLIYLELTELQFTEDQG